MHKISDGTEKNEAHVQESKVESSKQDLAVGVCIMIMLYL